MKTANVRAGLAFGVLAAVIAGTAAAFFFGDGLSTEQLSMLGMLLMALIGEMKTSFAHFFDGVAPAARPTVPAPDSAPAVPAVPGAIPALKE